MDNNKQKDTAFLEQLPLTSAEEVMLFSSDLKQNCSKKKVLVSLQS
jgi:hypothetical protein